ncbi:hypothetical protein P5V15_010820, partial [Pogonomyrmex californicus]
MACIRAPRSVRGSIDDIKADSTRNVVQIYTDWANYYLERGGCKRRVADLQADLCDGVLLADLVEAVTLRALGADVGAVNPGELAAGSTLWPVLALLFALSRYKQRAKQLQDMPRLPSPYNKQSSGVGGAGGGSGGSTSIPLPATVAATRRCPPDKVRPVPAPTHQSQLGNPRASTVGRPNGGLRSQQQALPYSGNIVPAPQPNKNSVLDKFKLFNNKDKNQERGKASSGVSKRTSSSSGFSSARSEHSDSSTSLCDQSKTQVQESPKSRALKSKLQSAKPAKQASPKAGRKEQSKTQSKIARTSKGLPSSSEKLTVPYNPVVEQDVKIVGKAIGTKLPNDRKTPTLQELVKQPTVQQPPKPNPSALTSSRQINLQDTKNVNLRNEFPTTKLSPRPKMELPGKIADPKIYLQNAKLPNGLNKDFMMQKTILANTNGIIKPSDAEETLVRENDTFNRTLSMNQANLSDGKDLTAKQKESEVLEVNHEQQSDIESFDSPSKTRISNQEKVICEEEIESVDVPNEKQNSETNRTDSVIDEKPANAEDGLTSMSAQTNLNFGSNKPLAGSNSPLHGSNPAGLSPGSSIPKPTALVKGTSKPSKENSTASGVPTPTKPKSGDILHRKLDPNTVAMVSPMPSISDLMSESSHSNSNSTGQSNSSDSSVIYRPSSESGSEIKTIPNRKIDTTFEQMEKVLSESSTCGSALADDEAEMTVKPMQPLLRGYTPGARGLQTLPSRTTGRQYTVLHSSSHHHVGGHHDYADVDVASGYLSDGEVLRGGGMSVGSRTLSDLCDGYMSEGGASLYARRINPSYGHEHDRNTPEAMQTPSPNSLRHNRGRAYHPLETRRAFRKFNILCRDPPTTLIAIAEENPIEPATKTSAYSDDYRT